MRLTKNKKIELLYTVNRLIGQLKVVEDLKIYKYEIHAYLSEKDFLTLRDIKTQLSNDIFC